MKNVMNWLAEVYHYFLGENIKTAEGKALFADRIVEMIMGATALGVLLYNSLSASRPILANILLFVIAIRFWASRMSVGQEIKISAGLYPDGRIPDNMAHESHLSIAFQIAVFVIAYMILGAVTSNIVLSSFLLFIISCFDYRTRHIISKNVLKTFSDTKYMPNESGKDYDKIIKSRAIAHWYLVDLPTRRKEGLCIIGCLLSLGLSTYYHDKNSSADVAAYIVLIVTLTANEIVAHRWRIMRYQRLRSINLAE